MQLICPRSCRAERVVAKGNVAVYDALEGVKHMLTQFKRFATSLTAGVKAAREDGQALVEYSLILGLISIAAIVTLGLLGEDIVKALEKVTNVL
jgi:Flp pilus assembly pilin Flp